MSTYKYDFTADENEKQRTYDWQKMYEQQNLQSQDYREKLANDERIWQDRFNKENEEYNRRILEGTSMQVKGLQAAGVNPAAAFSSGSGLSLPAVQSPNTPAPSSFAGAGGSPSMIASPSSETKFLDILQSIRALGETAKDGVLSYDTLSMLGANLKGKLTDNQLKESIKDFQLMSNEVYKVFGRSEKGSEIMRNVTQSLLNASQGKKEEALEGYYKSMDELTKTTNKKEQEILPFISQWWQSSIKLMDANTRSANQDVLTGRAQAHYYHSAANEQDALAATEDALREWREMSAKYSAYIDKNEFTVLDGTTRNRMNKIVNESLASDVLPDQMRVDLERAKKDNDWYTVRQLLGIADRGIEVYKARNGGRMVSAMEVRNEIEDRYNRYLQDTYDYTDSYDTYTPQGNKLHVTRHQRAKRGTIR